MMASLATLGKVRVLVLGDSGVGKSSLVHLMACDKPLTHIKFTVGAEAEVRLHAFREGTPQQQPFWIELLDVGGFQSHANTRHVFYGHVQGLILVHDLTNRRSQDNLRLWIKDFLDREQEMSRGELLGPTTNTADVPILVVGTKLDQALEGGVLPTHQRRSFVSEEYLAEEIHLNCRDAKALAPGSSTANRLARFFDKVIEKHHFKRDKGLNQANNVFHNAFGERKRL